ncbi:type II toxin-antitoxin system VapC family toxin [Zavarzinia sp.]|uniref:type II toxin-antitoxin system VapC family toxin n=1 Tax=Zavarzinia sp. TaxID=2027920 RepID=UPI003561668B
MSLVVDCSIAMTWCFEDEATPATEAILDRVCNEGAVVPALWHLEVGNVLIQAERRGRIAWAEALRRLSLIERLPIEIDPHRPGDGLAVADLARAEGLTAYDGAYLHLALGRGLMLATLDKALAAAARRRGIGLLPA